MLNVYAVTYSSEVCYELTKYMHEDIKIGALVKAIFQTLWQDLAFATKCSLIMSSSLFWFRAEFL